jgi:CheY-like chemotaxis protein
VTAFATSADALLAVEAERPDVLVSDIGMPGEDGYAFIRHLRGLADSAQADVPVVALTAYARGEDRARTRQAGFDAHLAKPIDPVALCDTILQLARDRPPESPEPPPPSNHS